MLSTLKNIYLVAITALVILYSCWFFYMDVNNNDELSSKNEWSVVQGVEFSHRNIVGTNYGVSIIGKYAFVQIPAEKARHKIWIMLNPQHPPYYKQLPEGNYVLPKEAFKEIIASGLVNSTVKNCLESHIEQLE